jgi:hypothetical protein
MVQGTDFRITCTFSEDPGQEREADPYNRLQPGRLAPQGVERPVHAGVQ